MNKEVNNAIEILTKGGIILYPTDTVWGIGCDATNKIAVQKVYDLKQRSDAKSLIILLPDTKSIFNYSASPLPDIMGLLATFDRPTTIIYPQAIGLPDNLIHEDGTIAMRVTSNAFCKMLLKRFKKPIVSTSANISGHPNPKNFQEIESAIKEGVDYIVDERYEEHSDGRPSKIIKIDDIGNVIVIRP